MSKFDEWYDVTAETIHHSDGQDFARAAWNKQQEVIDKQQALLEKAIARLEGYPCDMSCYVTQDELDSAKRMKESMIRILKEEMG